MSGAESAPIEVDINALAEICARYGVAELQVFGSFARGEAGPDSDIDLLYRLQPDAHLGWEIFDLEDELAELFGRPVDLVSMKYATTSRLKPASSMQRDRRFVDEMIEAAARIVELVGDAQPRLAARHRRQRSQHPR